MNIKELKEKIKDLPDTMDVFLDQRLTDFTYGLANSAEVKKIDFTEEPEGEVLNSYECFVLSEE